jgi:hypothetical protein
MNKLIELYRSIPTIVRVLIVICIISFEIIPMFKDSINLDGTVVANTISDRAAAMDREEDKAQ